MSKIEVNTVDVASGSTLTLGSSGKTITIPAGATISNAGTSSGFGGSGAVSWETTPKTGTFTGATGVGYFVNTTSAVAQLNLPAGSAGNIIAVSDYARKFATNKLTINPNGSEKIGGVAEDLILQVNGQALTLIYIDATQGWINVQNAEDTETGQPPFVVATGGSVAESGDFKIHTFTSPGTFAVTNAGGSGGSNTVDYLVVAGGASGGVRAPGNANGGGGAGGFRYSASTFTSPSCSPAHPIRVTSGLAVPVQSYSITVGAGGAAIPPPPGSNEVQGNPGSVSTFSGITSAGGGGGGAGGGPGAGANGGSGGGSGGGGVKSGGTGNTPPVSPAQGKNGGSNTGTSPDGQASGGGGAIAVGTNAAPNSNGVGGAGAGITADFGTIGVPSGSFRFLSGGGGAGNKDSVDRAAGGLGGGGAGGKPGSTATAGTTNSGGGGGGGTDSSPLTPSGAGGSGIVVIRYKFK